MAVDIGNYSPLAMYKLADLLQMPLNYDGKTVTGEAKMEWEMLPNFKVPVQLTAKHIFLSEQVGVLVHVLGDLHILAAYNTARMGLSAYLISLPEALRDKIVIDKKMDLIEVLDVLGAAMVSAFYLTAQGWKPLKVPK